MSETIRGMRWYVSCRLPALLCGLLLTADAGGAEARIAVATNFAEVAAKLETHFERATGHELIVVTGSTGKLFAQIVNGAPFHALLAADSTRPERLETSGAAVAGTRFSYANGRLVLWSADPTFLDAGGETTLRRGEFASLAIANPQLAPYGTAAREVLQVLGLWESLEDSVVNGENVGQAHALIATGNAALGFTALSYVNSARNARPGSRWDVPATLHAPIRQDAVLLRYGVDNAAAISFLEFLKSPDVRQTIRSFGYDIL